MCSYFRTGRASPVSTRIVLIPHPNPFCDSLRSSQEEKKGCNRLFYFAIPANVFASAGNAIKSKCMSRASGWTRIIVEKPFGHDLESCNELTQALAKNFREEHLYR